MAPAWQLRRAGACRLLAVVSLAVLAVGVPAPAVAVDLNARWPDLGLPGFKITFVLGNLLFDFPVGLTSRRFCPDERPAWHRADGPHQLHDQRGVAVRRVRLRPPLGDRLRVRYTTVGFDDDSGVTDLDREEHTFGVTPATTFERPFTRAQLRSFRFSSAGFAGAIRI